MGRDHSLNVCLLRGKGDRMGWARNGGRWVGDRERIQNAARVLLRA